MWGFSEYVGGIPASIQGFVDSDLLNVEDFVVFGNEISLSISNIQLSKEKLEKLSNKLAGLSATAGSVRNLKFSIAWKDIFSGALSLKLDGIELDLNIAKDFSSDLTESIWFDAISESIYETVQTVGVLDTVLEEEVADLLTEDEEESLRDSQSSPESQESDFKRGLLKAMIRDISVEVTGFKVTLWMTGDQSVIALIDRIELKDDTEDIRATEDNDTDPLRSIYIAKTVQIFGLELSIRTADDTSWPLMKMSSGSTDEPSFDFSAKVFKDRNCEIEGWASKIALYVSPNHVELATSLLSIISNGPKAVTNHERASILAFSFIKVEVGQMSMLLSEVPCEDLEAVSGICIEIVDSIVSRFDNKALDQVPITLTSSQYKISKFENGRQKVLSESSSLDAIKIILDGGSLHGQILDNLSFQIDKNTVTLAKKFQRAFDQSSPGNGMKNDESDPKSTLPIVLQVNSLDLDISDDIIPDCTGARLRIEGLLLTVCTGASSFSIQSALLTVNESSVKLEPTTLTRKINTSADLENLEPSDLDPFDEMYTMIEEERFLNVASAEKARHFQEQVQMSVERNFVVSSRGLKLIISPNDLLLLKLASKNLRSRPADGKPKPSGSIKALCALFDLELKFPTTVCKLSLADVVMFACKGIGSESRKLVDLRSDVVSLSKNQQLLMRRILNLSLDNSVKNIVITAEKSNDLEPRLALQISGLECKVPIKLNMNEEKEFFEKLSFKTKPDTSGKFPPAKYYASLFKCSVTPEFPKTWPRCFPSAVFADNIRIVANSMSELKCFISDGVLFLARRHKSPLMPGIYEEGFTYWRDHGYAPVCHMNFLKLSLEKPVKGGPVFIDLENQDVIVEVQEDSAHIARHFFDYLSNMGRYDTLSNLKTEVSSTMPIRAAGSIKHEMKDIDEFMFAKSLSPKDEKSKDPVQALDVDDEFFQSAKYEQKDASDESEVDVIEGAFASIEPNDQWEAVLEVPTAVSTSQGTLVVGSQESNALLFGQENSPIDVVHLNEGLSELVIDEEYFAKPLVQRDTFPFTSKADSPNLALRTKLHDFTVKIKLVEGSHFGSAASGIRSNSKAFGHPSSPYGFSPSGTASASIRSLKHPFYQESYSKTLSPTATSYSKWSALPPVPPNVQGKPDMVEIILERINCEIDWNKSSSLGTNLTSVRLAIPNVEIMDRVKKSRWKTILSRRTEKNEQTPLEDGCTFDTMVRCELCAVDADSENGLSAASSLEYRLKVRLLPLRVHMDQDSLIFLSKFASSVRQVPPRDESSEDDSGSEIPPLIEPLFFQHCDIGEISLRIDYKPKKIDFGNIRLGNFAEFVNFFQLEGAELRLPAASLRGVKGSAHFISELTRAWLPFIKGTQIPKMIKGIGPVRTAINLGQGVSDLILLPMNEYSREGRVLRGLKRGASSFIHSTVLESARLGSRLAIGTQVILEQVDDVFEGSNKADIPSDLPSRSKYTDQPESVQEGLLSAYQSLSSSLGEALQTIIAVPIQVYERSGPEGAVKAVIRAVPIAVLRPVIGATEAVSKTLMGIENTLDPSRGIEIKRKYKQDL